MPLRPRNTRQLLARALRYIRDYCLRRAAEMSRVAEAIIGAYPRLGKQLRALAATLMASSQLAAQIRREITAPDHAEVSKRAKNKSK